MASLTTSPPVVPPLTAPANAPATVRIEPPHGWLELRLGEVWQYRELLYFFVWRDVKIRYKQTAIGVVWVVLQPLLTMLVFTLFFGRLAKLPSLGLPYPVFYFAAVVPWMYFSSALQNCTNVVVDNQRVITKVFFPRLILPISAVLSGTGDFYSGVWISSDAGGAVAARIAAAGGDDGVGSGVVDLGAKRTVSRRAIRDSLPGAILDAGVAGGVSERFGAGAVAVALWIKSDGGRDRWISLGHDRARTSAGDVVVSVRYRSCGVGGWRIVFLPADGRGDRGPGVDGGRGVACRIGLPPDFNNTN